MRRKQGKNKTPKNCFECKRTPIFEAAAGQIKFADLSDREFVAAPENQVGRNQCGNDVDITGSNPFGSILFAEKKKSLNRV